MVAPTMGGQNKESQNAKGKGIARSFVKGKGMPGTC